MSANPPARPDLLPAQGGPREARPATGREHRYDIDLLRLVGSTSVILAHVSAAFIEAVGQDQDNGAAAYWAGFAGDSAMAFAVPLFFAIAGWAVLTGAPPRDGDRVWQRIVRNTVPLFIWSWLYILWGALRDTNGKPAYELAVDALFGSVEPAYHLWFMYAYIAIVAMLALATLLRAGQRPVRLALALLAVVAAGPVLHTAGEIIDRDLPEVHWGFGTYQVVYAVGGALLLSLPLALPRRHRWLLLPAMAVLSAGILWYNTEIAYVIPNAHPFVALLTVCVLLALVRVPVPEHRRPLLSKLAGAALGAYMVHVFFVEEIVDRLITADAGVLATGLVLVVSLVVTVFLSYAASLLWGRLGLRRWLG